jgi:hypothetical protein
MSAEAGAFAARRVKIFNWIVAAFFAMSSS